MKFEKLRATREMLLYIAERLSLEQEIKNKTNLISTVMPDAEINFDLDYFLRSYAELLEKNYEIARALEDSIKRIDQITLDDGLALSSNASYREIFSPDNLLEVESVLAYHDRAEAVLQGTISKYVSWQHPSLFLAFRDNRQRIEYFSAGDPLYLLGPDIDTMKIWISKYPEIYQRRLRLYQFNKDNFSQLPQNQFGFIFCWDFFNNITVDQIDLYVRSIKNLLRPGGVLMFTYTNAELSLTAKNVDDHKIPWASKTYIKNLLLREGYEIINFSDIKLFDSYMSWVEVKVPGEIISARRSQVLGQIKRK